MSRTRPSRYARPPHDSTTVPPRELDPARSKSVEAIEQEVEQIVDASAARARARHQLEGGLEGTKEKTRTGQETADRSARARRRPGGDGKTRGMP